MADTAYWRDAYEQHAPAVLAFLRSRLGSREDAEELLQETFVRAMRTRAGGDGVTAVRGYLFTTAHNLLRNHRRRQAVSPLVAADEPPEVAEPGAPDARARLRSLVARLGDVLAGLPGDHRQAFELAVLERLPYREIAHRTGWSVAKVKVTVYRARRRVIADLGLSPAEASS